MMAMTALTHPQPGRGRRHRALRRGEGAAVGAAGTSAGAGRW